MKTPKEETEQRIELVLQETRNRSRKAERSPLQRKRRRGAEVLEVEAAERQRTRERRFPGGEEKRPQRTKRSPRKRSQDQKSRDRQTSYPRIVSQKKKESQTRLKRSEKSEQRILLEEGSSSTDQKERRRGRRESIGTTRKRDLQEEGRQGRQEPLQGHLLEEGRNRLGGEDPSQRTTTDQRAFVIIPSGIRQSSTRIEARRRGCSKRRRERGKEKERATSGEGYNGAKESYGEASCCQSSCERKSESKGKRSTQSQSSSEGEGRRSPSEKRPAWVEETCSRRDEPIREVPRRPRRVDHRAWPGRMEGRHDGCREQGIVLGGRSASRREDPGSQRGRRKAPSNPGTTGKPSGGIGPLEGLPPFAPLAGRALWGRLPQPEQRWAHPCQEGEEDDRGEQGRMGGQPPWSSKGGTRRDGSYEEDSRGGREPRQGKEEEEGEKLREFRREEEEKEVKKEEEGKDESEWNKGFGQGLQCDRTGPTGFSQKGTEEEGKEARGKEGRSQEFRELGGLRDVGFRRGREGGARRAIWRRDKGEESVESVPWYPHTQHCRDDADHGRQHEWTAVGPRSRHCSTNLHSVLENGATAENDRPSCSREPNAGVCPGPVDPGTGVIGSRHSDAAPQEPGADCVGWPLQHHSAPRAGATGGHEPFISDGGVGGLQTAEGGEQGKSSRFRELGTPTGVGPPGGAEAERKGKGWKGEKQVERKWRKEPEGGRQEQEDLSLRADDPIKEGGPKSSEGYETVSPKILGSRLGPFGDTPAEGSLLEGLGTGSLVTSAGSGARVFPVKGQSLSEIAGFLVHGFLDASAQFSSLHSMSKNSGSIFPLPETLAVIQQTLSIWDQQLSQMVQMMCSGLNSYYGISGYDRPILPAATVSAMKSLLSYAEDVHGWSEKFEGLSWDDYLNVKSVDYQGEEVKIAKPFGWCNIEPALPSGIGSIPLEEVCELGTKEFVLAFEEYLVPVEARVVSKTPRVMVDPNEWEQVCAGLLEKGVCSLLPLREVCRVQDKPVLNGMFGVTKNEFTEQGVEIMRLIMNLVPTNRLCRSLGGDITTLPSWAGMSPYILGEDEVVVMSSEDVRCFFYLFSIPRSWWPYMCFGKEVPGSLWPKGEQGPFFLCSRVLPMGFINSVSIAQHVHRRIARLALHTRELGLGPQDEIRKDYPFPVGKCLYRVYLDNFDILHRMDSRTAALVRGQVSDEATALRDAYLAVGLPRHPKKSVQQQTKAEIQGAIVDGVAGLVKPKPQKVIKYIELALLLLEKGDSSQRQMQIVCGGFVYCCMFRRALLGTLNAVWQFIVSFAGDPPFIRRAIPPSVRSELLRFICLTPLAQMNLRAPMKGAVTASDASEYGGGFCISNGLTPMGCHAVGCNVRGEVFEVEDHIQVLTVGLFDGIGALRVSTDCLSLPMAGHVSSEVNKEGTRVIATHFPDTEAVGNVEDINEEMVLQWSLRYSNVGVVLVGGGPPCQGVSGLNADRKGSLKDARSKLFVHVPRVVELCKRFFTWAQVHHLMESVASMDEADRVVMSKAIGCLPWRIDSEGLSLCRRPRLYWVSWELQAWQGVVLTPPLGSSWEHYGTVELKGSLDPADFLTSGWKMNCDIFPTFTTSRPRESPGNRPAGLWQCEPHEVTRWKGDKHRFPPYIYRDIHCLSNAEGELRLPNIQEKEVIMGFPCDYTACCMPKQHQKGEAFLDARLTLIGNSWHVPVITVLLAQLFRPLGMTQVDSVDAVVKLCTPGTSGNLATFLRRPPLKQQRQAQRPGTEVQLSKKLVNFISVKGEDLLLQASSENAVRFHRLRTSVPSRLWRWKVVCGWPWKHEGFHINVLELQAVLTSLQWRLERKKDLRCRFIHLTDSLVTLHALTRGRSSSRKLRAVLSKINALLLAGDVRPIWAYVSTKQNPADRPSRRPVQKVCRKRRHI